MTTHPRPTDPVSALTRADGTTFAHSEAHGQTMDMFVNVKNFGAHGNGSHNDSPAIQDAVDYMRSKRYTGTLLFPPGEYVMEEGVDLSSSEPGIHRRIHVMGGHQSSGYNQGQYPPTTTIFATSITDGPVFYADTVGALASHTWENLQVFAGRTGWHYREASDVKFKNCGATVQSTGHADNCAVLMENCFWFWFQGGGGYGGPDAFSPSMILRALDPPINIGGYLIDFRDVQFLGGGMEVQSTTSYGIGYTLSFQNVISESTENYPMLKYVEDGVTGAYEVHGVTMINCQVADSIQNTPLIVMDAPNMHMFNPWIVNGGASGYVGIRVDQGNIYNPRVQSSLGSGYTPYVMDGSGNLLAEIWDKAWGVDYRGTEAQPLVTDLQSNHGAMHRFARSGDRYARAANDSSGKHYWGPGGATSSGYDTELSRSTANVLSLGEDDAIKTGAAIHGSLPVATAYEAGAQYYCTTHKQPVWSDAFNWIESDGSAH